MTEDKKPRFFIRVENGTKDWILFGDSNCVEDAAAESADFVIEVLEMLLEDGDEGVANVTFARKDMTDQEVNDLDG